MPDLNDLSDDEVRARLGLEIGEGLEGRIEGHMVRAMPEPFDPETEADLELADMRELEGK